MLAGWVGETEVEVCGPVGVAGAEIPVLEPSVAVLVVSELVVSELAGGAAAEEVSIVADEPGTTVAGIEALGAGVPAVVASVEAGTVLALLLGTGGAGVVDDSAVPGGGTGVPAVAMVSEVSVAEVVGVTVPSTPPQELTVT